MNRNEVQVDPIELPAEWRGFFETRGPVTARLEDRRRFPRFHCRGKATAESIASLPALPRDSSKWPIYTKDAGRGGIAIVHSEQFFPGEHLRITLSDGKQFDVEVVRCIRHNARCYEIGTRFLTHLMNLAP